MLNTFIPTLTGEWLNCDKISIFAIGQYPEDQQFYVVAVLDNKDQNHETSRWVLSKHDSKRDAQKSLDRLMFHMGPVPNLQSYDDFFESYGEVAKRMYYLTCEDAKGEECGSN